MRIWIDCEFNEFGGQLISLALVSEDGDEWYQALHCPNPTPWVSDNVMPVLKTKPIDHPYFTRLLQRWLKQYPTIRVIADWPEDISYFCRALITAPGKCINIPPLTMEVRHDLDLIPSATPHNALADARAIRDSHLRIEQMLGRI